MKNKILKLSILIILAITLTLSFVSCGSGENIADDASGSWEGISWEYKKEGQTLTLTGTGDMKNASSADKIGWAQIRSSVKKVILSDTLTSIGDYAFYGMTSLESIKLSQNIKSIGKYAFSFCSSLANISLPDGISSIGESAFEGCSALTMVKVPSTVTYLGNRVFAFCRQLKTVILSCQLENGVGSWSFKECEALSAVCATESTAFAKDAFEDAAIDTTKVKTLIADKVTINVYYKDTDGNTIKEARAPETKTVGDSYSVVAAAIEGYTVDGAESYTGIVLGDKEAYDFTFKYKKNAVVQAPEKPEETTPDNSSTSKDNGVSVGTVIALCIFGVVILGVCIGAFMLIRADKKQKKSSTTVRNKTKNQKKK